MKISLRNFILYHVLMSLVFCMPPFWGGLQRPAEVYTNKEVKMSRRERLIHHVDAAVSKIDAVSAVGAVSEAVPIDIKSEVAICPSSSRKEDKELLFTPPKEAMLVLEDLTGEIESDFSVLTEAAAASHESSLLKISYAKSCERIDQIFRNYEQLVDDNKFRVLTRCRIERPETYLESMTHNGTVSFVSIIPYLSYLKDYNVESYTILRNALYDTYCMLNN